MSDANEDSSPFHDGEQSIQDRVGVRDRIEAFARRVVRSFLTEQHRAFFEQLPMLLVASASRDGRPEASLLVGAPGFVYAKDERTLRVDARPHESDPLASRLAPGLEVGVLGIELHTRRRNRLSGVVTRCDAQGFDIAVKQSFGNCPQYIHARHFELVSSLDARPTTTRLDALDDLSRAWIRGADTFFIASAFVDGSDAPSRGADVSHRGGAPGFVRIEDDHTLLVPDFAGNNHFNTLGNIAKNPRVSLLVLHFESGGLLRISARAEVLWDKPGALSEFVGAERFVRFHVDEVVRIEGVVALRWRDGSPSPNNALVGSFEQAEASYEARRARDRFVPYVVTRIVDESSVIRSLYLRRADGGPVPVHRAGQYLPIRVAVAPDAPPISRLYTISDAPRRDTLRISVRRESRPGRPPGVASNFLHDGIAIGAVIEARAPRGEFVLDTESPRVAVLVSAGVGVTPMMAMLEEIAARAVRLRERRRVFFIHGAVDGSTHAFKKRVREIAAALESIEVHVCYDAPRPEDQIGRDYESAGRVDLRLLQSVLPFGDHDFYLCGPREFMSSLYAGLSQVGVRAERIRYEAFGPATIVSPATPRGSTLGETDDARPVLVALRRSKKTLAWTPSRGSLLELLESAGVDVASSCRRGECSSCRTSIEAGSVAYSREPTGERASGEILVCCATPVRADDEARVREGADVVLDL